MSYQQPGIDITRIDTSATAVLGQLYVDNLGNHYRYMQADGAVTAYNLYSYIQGTWQIDAQIDLTVTPADGESVPVCVWDQSSTALADDEYAWVFVGPGAFTTTTAASVAADAIIYGHATAGLVDDAATAIILNGVTCPVAIGSATTGTFYAMSQMWATDLP